MRTGIHISTIFLEQFRETFPTVRITTRDPSSEKAQVLAKKGAEIFAFSSAWGAVLQGADVVINTLPVSVCVGINKELVNAMLAAGTKVYFPSEFGTYVPFTSSVSLVPFSSNFFTYSLS